MTTMRDIMTLVEAWDQTVRRPEPLYPFQVDVFRNPSSVEFRKLIRDHGTLRAFIERNGDLVVWDANDATHADMQEVGGYTNQTEPCNIYLRADHASISSMHMGRNEGDGPDEFHFRGIIRHVYDLIQKNGTLRRIYGSPVPVIGDGSDQARGVAINPEWLERNVIP